MALLLLFLCAQRREGVVLQAAHFQLQEAKIHRRAPGEVLAGGLGHALAVDREEGDSPAVRAAQPHAQQLAAARE
jgi:hypothetical protein